ncbi:hypothetical protein JXB02_01235 [Candidatus Woesearchaeota archaeon]|nr:hypothetical protein [Candidatus Woesearchaeota archaeon]
MHATIEYPPDLLRTALYTLLFTLLGGAPSLFGQQAGEGTAPGAHPLRTGKGVHDLRYPTGLSLDDAVEEMDRRLEAMKADYRMRTSVPDELDLSKVTAANVAAAGDGGPNPVLGLFKPAVVPNPQDSTDYRECFPEDFHVLAQPGARNAGIDSLKAYSVVDGKRVFHDHVPVLAGAPLDSSYGFPRGFALVGLDSVMVEVVAKRGALESDPLTLNVYHDEKWGVFGLPGDVVKDLIVNLTDYLQVALHYGRHIWDGRTPRWNTISTVDIAGKNPPENIIVWDGMDSLADILVIFANYGAQINNALGKALTSLSDTGRAMKPVGAASLLERGLRHQAGVSQRDADVSLLERMVKRYGPVEFTTSSQADSLGKVSYTVSDVQALGADGAKSLFLSAEPQGPDTLIIGMHAFETLERVYGLELRDIVANGELWVEQTKSFGGQSVAAMTPVESYIESLLGDRSGADLKDGIVRLMLVGDGIARHPELSFRYELAQRDGWGIRTLEMSGLSLAENRGTAPSVLPGTPVLYGQNYPNPFNAGTRIPFEVRSLSDPYEMELSVFDILGRKVHEDRLRVGGPGRYEFRWDGTNLYGSAAASGTYIYTLKSPDKVHVNRMQLVK